MTRPDPWWRYELSPVPLLRNVICAFCRTAPVGSVTVPVNAPVEAD